MLVAKKTQVVLELDGHSRTQDDSRIVFEKLEADLLLPTRDCNLCTNSEPSLDLMTTFCPYLGNLGNQSSCDSQTKLRQQSSHENVDPSRGACCCTHKPGPAVATSGNDSSLLLFLSPAVNIQSGSEHVGSPINFLCN